jgi:hypothetical protein
MNAFCIVQGSYEISLLIFPMPINLLASAREMKGFCKVISCSSNLLFSALQQQRIHAENTHITTEKAICVEE